MGQFYRDYADYLAERFEGKVQKLTVNAGFSCPNRDGTLGRGGCVYCNNVSFSPQIAAGDVVRQLEEGKRFFARKYPHMRYLAYFQSYTNTHGPIEDLMELYARAAGVEGVVGIIIGTRPDCVPDSLLDRLITLPVPVMMEYGAETSHDTTLTAINRCHTWAQTVDAVERTAARGIDVGLHFIMGLPGETRAMMLETVRRAAALPVATVKFHQLQVIAGTPLAREAVWAEDKSRATFRGLPVHMFAVEEYVELCVEIVRELRQANPAVAIERFTSQAPEGMLMAPRWGLKNYQFVNLLTNRLRQIETDEPF
jgi:radical SAM protein, TIGR01212 family